MIAAILRAQFLSMRIGIRRGAGFGIVMGVVWYGLWLGAAVAAWFLGSRAALEQLRQNLPFVLLFVFLYWQMIPILSASMGSSLDMRKLLAYPVPHRKLFLIEVLLRLTTSAEMILVLTGGALGLLRNRAVGGWPALPRIGITLPIFIVFNLLLASGLRSILERLLTRRKVRELMAVVMGCLWLLPRMITSFDIHPKWLGPAGNVLRGLALPWSAAAHAALGDAGPAGLAAMLAWLSAWVFAALWFGRTQFERGLRYDPVAAQATVLRPAAARSHSPTPGLKERLYRLPGLLWSDPLAAIVEKELRSLARTPRFRMVFVMGFTFGVMMWMPVFIGRHGAGRSSFSSYVFLMVCGYSLLLLGQVTYWNCFGFDRSAALFYYAVPRPFTQVLIGKNIVSLIFIYLECLILAVVMAALRVVRSWENVIETLIVIGIASVYLLGLGNLASVRYPRPMNPERVSQGSSSGRMQGLVFLLFPLALFPIGLAYLGRYAFNSQIIFALLLAIAAIAGGAMYWMCMESAVSSAMGRREEIMRELSRGEGPVVSE